MSDIGNIQKEIEKRVFNHFSKESSHNSGLKQELENLFDEMYTQIPQPERNIESSLDKETGVLTIKMDISVDELCLIDGIEHSPEGER